MALASNVTFPKQGTLSPSEVKELETIKEAQDKRKVPWVCSLGDRVLL